jgi:SAM-dependent methyltransferase
MPTREEKEVFYEAFTPSESNSAESSQLSRIHWFLPFIRGKVLEVGCCTGGLTKILIRLPKVEKIVAIDVTDDLVEATKRTLEIVGCPEGKVEVRKCYAEDMDEMEKFDTIQVGCVIEQVVDDAKLMQKWYNMLSDKGQLLLATTIGEVTPIPMYGRLRYYSIQDTYDLVNKVRGPQDSFWVTVNSYHMKDPALHWILLRLLKGVPPIEVTRERWDSREPLMENILVL